MNQISNIEINRNSWCAQFLLVYALTLWIDDESDAKEFPTDNH